MHSHRLLVVIPALDEEFHIEACVRSLVEGEPCMRDVDIVVADGGSSDRTREVVARLAVEFPRVVLIDNPGRLQAAAINFAVATQARPAHAVLVRCDAHAVYPPGYALDVARVLEERGVASVVTPMDAIGEGCFQRAAAWIVDTPLGSGGSAHRGGTRSQFVDHGHHASFDLAWFRRVGGYDERFAWNEDAEYDHRLRQAGGRIWLEATIRVGYRMRASIVALARQYRRYGYGRALNLLKHRARPRIRQVIPVLHVVAFAGSLLLSTVWCWALLYPSLYLAILAVVSVSAAVAMRSLCGLHAGPALAAMHIAWGVGFLEGALAGAPRRPP